MAALGHDMRDVELVDEEGTPGAPSSAERGVRARSAARPVASRPARRSVVTAALLVAGLVLGDVTLDARARAGQASLTRVPGVLAPLDAPVVELWRAHPGVGPALVEAGGVLVGVRAARGAADVVGLDPATGALAWRRPVRGPGPLGTGGGARCDAPAPAPGPATGPPHRAVPVVVCVVDRAALLPRPDAPARPAAGAVAADRLLTLDARTGEVLADRAVPRSTVLAVLGGDVVTGHVDPRGYVRVTRTDPLGQRVRWRFTAPHPLPRSHLAWTTRIRVEAGMVVVDETHGWVLDGDGRVLHSWAVSPGAHPERTAQVLAGGRYLARPDPDGSPNPRVRLTDLRTGAECVVPGRPVTTVPDDGSAHDRVLVARDGGTLVAHDPCGGVRWTGPGGVQGRAVLLAGRLYRIGPSDLSAVDARSGAPLWSTPLVRTPRTALFTDGRVAVVTRRHPDDGVVLTAYDLADGRERWTVDLADDIASLTASGGRLLGWTGDQVVVLGRPAG